jgi:hypothetical protein
MNESPAGAGQRASATTLTRSRPRWLRGSRCSTPLRVDKSNRLERRFYSFPDRSLYTSTVEKAIRTLPHSADRRETGPSSPPEVGSGRPRSPGSAATFRSEQPGPVGGRQPPSARGRPAGSGGLPPTRKGDRQRDDHREDRPDAAAAVRGGRRRSAVLHLTFVRTTQERRKPGSTGFPVAPDVVARWSA